MPTEADIFPACFYFYLVFVPMTFQPLLRTVGQISGATGKNLLVELHFGIVGRSHASFVHNPADTYMNADGTCSAMQAKSSEALAATSGCSMVPGIASSRM